MRVPQRNLIGMEGAGFMYQMIQFQEERLWGAANSIEGMMHVLNETINYTRQRNLFGSTVLDQQVVHFTLAELKTEIEALRALVWQATEEYVAGGEVTELASMCKFARLRPCKLMLLKHRQSANSLQSGKNSISGFEGFCNHVSVMRL